MSRWGLAVLCSLGLFTAAHAAVDPSEFQALHWRLIGPFRGGRVLAVTGVPGQPHHFYFGSVNGGVWETVDAGRTWSPISDALPVGSIGALAVAPSAPNVLYVGTGEADMRSDIAQGAGLFKSTDSGRTWSFIGLPDSQQIGKILVDPRDPNRVLVAALGHPYGPNPTRGVFRSTDGGRTWTKVLYKDADTGAIDLAFRPGDPDTVYASLWQTRRPPWNVYPPSNGPGGGLYKSTDGGATWRPLAGGLPADPGHIGIAVAPSRPDRVFALVDAPAGGLYRSDDAGATWTRVSADRRIWQRGWYFGGVTVDPRNPDVVFICNTAVYRSDDGGRTFTPIKGAPGGDDYHTLWIDPADPMRRILGVDQGTLVTLDGGATWSSWYNQPTGQFYHVVTDNRFPYWVYGAQQDSGAAGVPSRTGSMDGINLTNFREITAGGESDNVAPDPNDPETIFGGRVDKLDTRTGQTKNVDPTLAFPEHYRGTWTLPLVFSKRDPKALYFGNQRIFRTTDGGDHWTPISPDLTRPDPGAPPTLDPATVKDVAAPGPRKGVVYAIGPSPIADGLIWAGTDDGLVWRTTDNGGTWRQVTPAGLQPWSKIGVVEPSHFDPETAYIAVDRHRLDDFRPYVYRTHDGGRSWTLIADGLAEGGTLNSVNVVREDPVRRGLLYAGTERGVFVSFDDGNHWQPLQANLPRTSVRDIDVHGDDLVIATHGRAFWIMDDIAPLRTLAAEPAPATRLFAPAVAYRVRPFGFTGTPMPKDEPMAPNPPDGAFIDYALARPPRGPVELSIYDAQGQLVRRFSSADKPTPIDLFKIEIAPEWIVEPEPLRATPGQHRFVWNLHYAQTPGVEPGEGQEAGVWAPPGHYTVELSVDGQRWRQPLELRPDPRVKAGPEAYRAEFDLARRIEAERARATAALAEAKALQARLSVAQGDPATRARFTELSKRLEAITDLPPPDNPRNSLPVEANSLTGVRFLSGELAKLEQAVDSADGGPTPDAVAGFEQDSRTLDATLQAWAAFKAEADRALGPSP